MRARPADDPRVTLSANEDLQGQIAVSCTRAIPAVVLTSSKEQRGMAGSFRPGVNSAIVKPVNCEGFAAAVQQLGRSWLLLNQTAGRA